MTVKPEHYRTILSGLETNTDLSNVDLPLIVDALPPMAVRAIVTVESQSYSITVRPIIGIQAHPPRE